MRKNLLTFYSPLICSPLVIIQTYSIWTVYIIIMISSMYGGKKTHLSYVKLINNCVQLHHCNKCAEATGLLFYLLYSREYYSFPQQSKGNYH